MRKDEPLAPTPRARGGHIDRRPIGGPMTTHAGLASGRWWTLTLAEQLGNAGGDGGRGGSYAPPAAGTISPDPLPSCSTPTSSPSPSQLGATASRAPRRRPAGPAALPAERLA